MTAGSAALALDCMIMPDVRGGGGLLSDALVPASQGVRGSL